VSFLASKATASKASRILKSKDSKQAKSIAGSVLTQRVDKKRSVKHHPLSTMASRKRWSKAVKAVQAKTK